MEDLRLHLTMVWGWSLEAGGGVAGAVRSPRLRAVTRVAPLVGVEAEILHRGHVDYRWRERGARRS
jgi:hypothetical protein